MTMCDALAEVLAEARAGSRVDKKKMADGLKALADSLYGELDAELDELVYKLMYDNHHTLSTAAITESLQRAGISVDESAVYRSVCFLISKGKAEVSSDEHGVDWGAASYDE